MTGSSFCFESSLAKGEKRSLKSVFKSVLKSDIPKLEVIFWTQH